MELKERYTIVIVTHNMQQAVRISDQTAFFLLGELVEYGNTEQMFSMPQRQAHRGLHHGEVRIMRSRFDEQLAQLNTRADRNGRAVRGGHRSGRQALLEGDTDLAQQVAAAGHGDRPARSGRSSPCA